MQYKFPDGFLWGSATSAHQVEGGNFNDWTEWEKTNAPRLADEAKREQQKWQREKFPEMLEPENYISGRACDHYNRYDEDFDMAKALGQNAHRFSIEWSRIEPEEGRFDEKEMEHYRQVVRALKERGIEPFLTLWHWPLPIWLAKKGGVKNKDFPEHFEQYVKKIAEALGGDVKNWLTINEPEIYALNSYYRGRWTPQKKGIFNFYFSMKSLVKAHQRAYRAIKKITPLSMVGVVCNLSDFKSSEGVVNAMLKIIFERFWNHRFLQRVDRQLDYIGLNFYFHNRINYGINKNKKEVVSDVGWDTHPEGIGNVLLSLKRYDKPVYITESGLADKDDKNRSWFIKETLGAVSKAMAGGVNVRGYFHWSLLDNFEWDKGFWPRFGLVEVDYRTMERKIRPSAWEYAKICKSNVVASE
jgi:beta-glucosidase